MARIEINLVINRPVEEVFVFISNAENLPRWRATNLETRKTSEGPLAVGSTFKGRFTFLGRQFDGNLRTTEYEPNTLYTSKMTDGPFPLETRYVLQPIDSGTRLIFSMEGESGGFFKLAEPLVVNLAKRTYEADLHNLKEMLEAQAV
jgi:uncharacterized protein YndB with AHSA1/START domain